MQYTYFDTIAIGHLLDMIVHMYYFFFRRSYEMVISFGMIYHKSNNILGKHLDL